MKKDVNPKDSCEKLTSNSGVYIFVFQWNKCSFPFPALERASVRLVSWDANSAYTKRGRTLVLVYHYCLIFLLQFVPKFCNITIVIAWISIELGNDRLLIK